MNRILRNLLTIILGLSSSLVSGQTTLDVETQATVSSGDHTPFWLQANKYGLSSLEKTNGYLRAHLYHPVSNDSTRDFEFGWGADVAVAHHFTSTMVIHQAYAEARWRHGLLTIGSKEQPLQLKSNELSSGSQTLGINSRPVPSVRLELKDYWTVPYTRGLVALKAHMAYGIQTDDRWQKDFSHQQSKYTEHTLIHTKSGYIRVGNPQRVVTMEIGLEMGCLFGGRSHQFSTGKESILENDGGFLGFLHAFVPAGGDKEEGDYKNKEGNHLGSYVLRLNIDQPTWNAGIYGDHFFEDSSQMLFFEYDGYGEGEHYNDWEKSRWFLYHLRDMMLGAEVRLKRQRWVNHLVCEYIYSKHQSGPVYHDRTPHLSDHVAGRDNYYNHYIHTGWQHWGQVQGNPLYRSPIYNEDGTIRVLNNRFSAWHIGIGGTPLPGMSYRILATWQQGFGTYDDPTTKPEYGRYFLAECKYAFPTNNVLHDWSIKCAFGYDHSYWTGDNIGGQVTLARRIPFN